MTPTYTPELFAALCLFTFAASITPGPNNTMLMASGANFGLRATLPHMAGVLVGFVCLIALCGLGLAGIFAAFPALRSVLKWGGAAYLVYLAFKIATAKGVGAGDRGERPMSFPGAVAFQFVNPKAWVTGLGMVTTYVPARGFLPNLMVALLICGAATIVSVSTWTTFGLGIRRLLTRPIALRTFNLVMAALLLASLYPLFSELRR